MAWYWWVLIFVLVVGAGVGAAFLGRVLYSRQVHRSLIALLGRREAIVAAARGIERVIEHLLSADDATLTAFAADPASEDRRAIGDIAIRMRLAADDLRQMALPKRLWSLAEDMERASAEIAKQAGAVGEADTPDAALDALAAIHMQEIRDDIAVVNARLEPLLDAFRVNDPAVYGGGLYI